MAATARRRPLTLTLNSEEIVNLIDERVRMALEALDADPWMNAEDAAEYLRCPRSRIYDLIQLGKVLPARDGSRVLFRRSALDAYLESGK